MSRKFVVEIDALFPQNILDWGADSANFFAFWMYVWKCESESVNVWKWKCESESVKVKLVYNVDSVMDLSSFSLQSESESVKVNVRKWKWFTM